MTINTTRELYQIAHRVLRIKISMDRLVSNGASIDEDGYIFDEYKSLSYYLFSIDDNDRFSAMNSAAKALGLISSGGMGFYLPDVHSDAYRELQEEESGIASYIHEKNNTVYNPSVHCVHGIMIELGFVQPPNITPADSCIKRLVNIMSSMDCDAFLAAVHDRENNGIDGETYKKMTETLDLLLFHYIDCPYDIPAPSVSVSLAN